MTNASVAVPTTAKWILAIQFVIALIFFALGWSHTASLRFGRGPVFADIVALGAPLLLVVFAAILVRAAARRGQRQWIWPITLTPLPLALILAMAAGMV